MKYGIILFICFCNFQGIAQELLEKKEYLVNRRAEFHVLQSDEKVRSGEYREISYRPPYRQVASGIYLNNKKEGIWVERYDNIYNHLKSTGVYQNDKRIGIWRYYDSNGVLMHKYDFDTNELLFNTECSSKKAVKVLKDGELVSIELSCPPSLLGGRDSIYFQIASKIAEFFREKDPKYEQYKVFDETISFFISEKGKVEQVEFSGKEKYPE